MMLVDKVIEIEVQFLLMHSDFARTVAQYASRMKCQATATLGFLIWPNSLAQHPE